ncbi:MAG: hypothetical protein LBE92_06410 [Chryseobacterium sp.]|jgi:nucleoside-diphosphate-sugar epimerase|uniref:hypothetical protein n=1 Tax=Chryseobacterium sp. TaxID=1871047 RepID=UPI0028398539|nr:hypothetical protein [Chryseobacterium sp.]MDR2235737.1 hypothetical protein [Chryseobacterium sp.]
MKNTGIIGYGWLGSRIAASLSEKYTIHTTATTTDKVSVLNAKGLNAVVASFPDYQLNDKILQWDSIQHIDVLIITIPLSGKSCCVSSLYNRIQNLLSFTGDFKGQVFVMSSTGVYPDIPKEFTEDDLSVSAVPGERMIRGRYPQANILRLGGLMGDNRLLKNYNISNPEAPVNHIHYADICSVILRMIETGTEGKLYNLTAPLHPSKAAVIHAQQNQPFSEEVVVQGRIIRSSKLVSELDFTFEYPDPCSFHIIKE